MHVVENGPPLAALTPALGSKINQRKISTEDASQKGSQQKKIKMKNTFGWEEINSLSFAFVNPCVYTSDYVCVCMYACMYVCMC